MQENFFAKNIAGQRIQQGLLVFSSAKEAEKAVKLTGHVLGDRHIILRRHHQCIQTSDSNDRTVHISNLSKGKQSSISFLIFLVMIQSRFMIPLCISPHRN